MQIMLFKHIGLIFTMISTMLHQNLKVLITNLKIQEHNPLHSTLGFFKAIINSQDYMC
ncbi:hypothetical protein GLOIN_2v1650678, partial [Rhizophagus irregularis DAOM 181602=DAOM 197198]